MNSSDVDPRRNQLLAAVPPAHWSRWAAVLEPSSLKLGQVMYEPGRRISHVHFPTTSIVSLLYLLEDGNSAEIALVGRDGLVGFSTFMGGITTSSRAVVQSRGASLRVPGAFLENEFNSCAPIRNLLLRYVQALMSQVVQTAVCNRHHALQQQLCRWLLLSLDALDGSELVMTQELIANMLGVRRGGVTEAALKLQQAGLIRYSRGHITVLDRAGLERLSCECYHVVKAEYQRLLPEPFPPTG